MATNANTTTASSDATVSTLMAQAVAEAESLKLGTRVLTQTLTRWMERIHGGSFRVQIDHEVGLIMIVRRLDTPIQKPKPGEVA